MRLSRPMLDRRKFVGPKRILSADGGFMKAPDVVAAPVAAGSVIEPAGIGPYAGILRPASAAQWTTFCGTPTSHLFNCQDAGQSLVSDTGVSMPRSGSTVGLFKQTVANWTTKWFITSSAGSSLSKWVTSSLYSPASESVMIYVITKRVAGTSTSTVWRIGYTGNVQIQATGIMRFWTQTAAVGTYNYEDNAIHPFLICYNRTNSLFRVYTDKEIGVATYTSCSNGEKGVGSSAASSNRQEYNQIAIWKGTTSVTLMTKEAGATAALKMENSARKFLTDLGWTVAW